MLPEANDYVECTECGHPLEEHNLKGCAQRNEHCPCTARWTRDQIREERRDAGLPVTFRRPR